MGRFTRNDARSVIFNFVSADVADTAETLYGSYDDLKNLDGHRFYQILMDAKNCTLSDPDTGVAMPVDTNFGAYRLYSFYKGLIWNVAKSTLVSEKLPDNIVATKEDEVRNFALKAFLMLSGEADKEDKIPDVYKSFDPEKVNWDVASGFANWLKMTLLTLARGVWKQSAEAGGDALSLEDFTTNDEGEDNSDRNAALAVEDHSDKTLVNTIFDNFIERVENGEIPEIRKTTLDIFKHARPFFNTPKDSNHMIYANYKRLLDTDAAKEIVQKALDQGKTKKQAILARRNYLIARAFETALKYSCIPNIATNAKKTSTTYLFPNVNINTTKGNPNNADITLFISIFFPSSSALFFNLLQIFSFFFDILLLLHLNLLLKNLASFYL